MTAELDRRLASVAAGQHGLLTRAQALAAGATPSVVDHRVASGRWIGVGRGLYRVAGVPFTWETRLVGACLAGPAVASHRSAAVLWGIGDVRPGRPEVTIPRGHRLQVAGVRVHESRDLGAADPRRLRGIPVTGVERTLIDLGMVCRAQHVEDALFDAIDRHVTTWDRVLWSFARHARKGRDGVGTMRSIIDRNLQRALPQSRLEALVERAIVDRDLPPPVRQHEIRDGRGFIARVDFAYPRLRIAIEADGRAVHARRLAFERDHAKRNRLALAGWTLLVVTWEMVVRDPIAVGQLVASARDRASASG
jgi:predicted transcriptional regulator of viral defense system/very-short-patch-repair endonuclease